MLAAPLRYRDPGAQDRLPDQFARVDLQTNVRVAIIHTQGDLASSSATPGGISH